VQSCWRSCGGSSDPVADYTNRDRQFAIACIALSCLGSGVVLLINYNSRRVLADELFMQVRFPSAVRIAPDKPVARLLDDAGQLKARLDKKRTEVESEDEGDDKEKD
jgi:hypothetical protein